MPPFWAVTLCKDATSWFFTDPLRRTGTHLSQGLFPCLEPATPPKRFFVDYFDPFFFCYVPSFFPFERLCPVLAQEHFSTVNTVCPPPP